MCEIHDQGHIGSHSLVSLWAAQRRKEHSETPSGVSDAPPESPSPQSQPTMHCLSPSQTAWLLVQPPADRNEDKYAAFDKLQKAVAEIVTDYSLAQDFVSFL